MSDYTIERVAGERAAHALAAVAGYAFGSSIPPNNSLAMYRKLLPARPDTVVMAGYIGDRPVTVAGYNPMTQNVRGVLQGCCGLWGVAAIPQVRRKGYTRALIEEMLAHARPDHPFAALYPFKASFYERLGYVRWPRPLHIRFDTVALRPTLYMELDGHCQQALLSESFRQFRAVADSYRSGQHGMAIYEGATVQNYIPRDKDLYTVYAVSDDGDLVGAMTYRINDDAHLRVRHFLPLSELGRYLLLNWLARHIDQCERVTMLYLPPAERPNTWLADLIVERITHFVDPMGRVLDLRGLVGLPAGEGSFSAHISDPHAPWNAGSYRFTSMDGRLYVEETSRPDCDLTIQGLSALVYGTHDPARFRLLGWGNPDTATQQLMRSLFPAAWPSLFEVF